MWDLPGELQIVHAEATCLIDYQCKVAPQKRLLLHEADEHNSTGSRCLRVSVLAMDAFVDT